MYERMLHWQQGGEQSTDIEEAQIAVKHVIDGLAESKRKIYMCLFWCKKKRTELR